MASSGKRFAEITVGNPSKCVAVTSVFLPESFTGDSAARTSALRSPHSFGGGAVGLGIVAAMSDSEMDEVPLVHSNPIPIVVRHLPAAAKHAVRQKAPARAEDHEGDEEDEWDTCLLAHKGGNWTRKKLFFNAGLDDAIAGDIGIFPYSPPPVTESYFLSCCYLCRKKLHGLDIFMYRGEKAFCSSECRYKQILSDEQKEKNWGTKSAKPLKLSPSPHLLPTSVLAV